MPIRRPLNAGILSIVAASLFYPGCTSTRTSTSPTEVKCQVAVAGSSAMVASAGGSTSVRVTAQPECAWSVVADANWIGDLRPASGQGNGDVQVNVAANTTPATRQGTVTINGTPVTISQEGAPCRFTVTGPSSPVPTEGGSVTITVTSVSGCTWTAQSSAGWLTASSNASGSGSGSVTFAAAANSGAARSAFVTIGGETATVSQSPAANCVVTVAPLDVVAPPAGATVPIAITTTPQCTWTASSPVPWATLAPASGAGSGSVTLAVSANGTAGDRTIALSVGGQIMSVSQAGVGCSYSLDPTSHAAPSTAAAASIGVTTNGPCPWTASTTASWITLAGATSGIGNGAVSLLIAANTGAARSDTVRVADQIFTVSQAAAPPTLCSYNLSGTSQPQIPAAGGSGTPVTVTTTATCTWTATTTDPWITVTPTSAVTGTGTMTYTVAANPTTSPRTGTIVVASQNVTVTQAASACAYSIAPTGQTGVPAAGGAGAAITVTTSAGCAWTAASNVPWLTAVTPASGTGGGTVTFTVQPNSGAARQGTLTVAGQDFTVDQLGTTPCSYAINPASQNIGAAGGAGSTITVTTAAGCAWTATSNVPWVTGVAPASGTGSGTVNFNVQANTGAARSGMLTIAGQAFTVNQAPAPACTFSINPATQNVSAAGGAGTPIAITTTAGCAWTAISNASWLTITSPTSGSGSGTVNVSVQANMQSVLRSGTLTIAGQTATINQGPCTTSINPTTVNVRTNAGATNLTTAVAAAATCSYPTVSNNSWITVVSAPSSGNGTVTFNVDPASLNGNQSRTGTITIGTSTLTVEQTRN